MCNVQGFASSNLNDLLDRTLDMSQAFFLRHSDFCFCVILMATIYKMYVPRSRADAQEVRPIYFQRNDSFIVLLEPKLKELLREQLIKLLGRQGMITELNATESANGVITY